MISAPDAILNALSEDYRRVLSRWRAFVYLRRASSEYAANDRRWSNIPESVADMDPLFRRMRTSGLIESVEGAPGCYSVSTPFAQVLPLREEELLFEANPYAVLTHYSALVFHGLTQNRPNLLTAWVGEPGWAIPIGTTQDDWSDIALPQVHRPHRVLEQDVRWFNRFSDFEFGVQTRYSGPVEVRVTDRERTLIDSLNWPEYAGGIVNVIQAWEMAQGFANIETIVDYTERYGIAILRQRVGFVAELVGFSHSRFDEWAHRSQRGGSNRLVSTRPFGSDVNSRWKLSINAPVEAFLS